MRASEYSYASGLIRPREMHIKIDTTAFEEGMARVAAATRTPLWPPRRMDWAGGSRARAAYRAKTRRRNRR